MNTLKIHLVLKRLKPLSYPSARFVWIVKSAKQTECDLTIQEKWAFEFFRLSKFYEYNSLVFSSYMILKSV